MVVRSETGQGVSNQEVALAYLNCPECYYRVRSDVAHSLDGESERVSSTFLNQYRSIPVRLA